jgi:hypothetical protein
MSKSNGGKKMQSEKKAHRSLFLRRVLLALILTISLLMLGFFALHNVFRIPNVSGVYIMSSNIGVYWNARGTLPVSTINWGNVSVGSEKDVTVYVKNLGPDALILSMNTSSWSSSAASLKMYLCWDFNGKQVEVGSMVKVILKLFVSPDISGVSDFSFNINMGVGLEKSRDINGDGIVSIKDATPLGLSWLAKAGSPNYNYRCDFNNDGIVNIADAAIRAASFGH